MTIAAICDTCGTQNPLRQGISMDDFLITLEKKGWRLAVDQTLCPACARGEQEILEGATLISYGLHELRHEPGKWSGVYWLSQKSGAYREMFRLPDDQLFSSEPDARNFAKEDAVRHIRAAEWP